MDEETGKKKTAFWYIVLSFKLKTTYFCQIRTLIQAYCRTVCKTNHMQAVDSSGT